MKIAGGNESGTGWQRTFVFSPTELSHSVRKKSVEKVSEVRHCGHEARRLLSIVKNEAKSQPNASAIS